MDICRTLACYIYFERFVLICGKRQVEVEFRQVRHCGDTISNADTERLTTQSLVLESEQGESGVSN